MDWDSKAGDAIKVAGGVVAAGAVLYGGVEAGDFLINVARERSAEAALVRADELARAQRGEPVDAERLAALRDEIIELSQATDSITAGEVKVYYSRYGSIDDWYVDLAEEVTLDTNLRGDLQSYRELNAWMHASIRYEYETSTPMRQIVPCGPDGELSGAVLQHLADLQVALNEPNIEALFTKSHEVPNDETLRALFDRAAAGFDAERARVGLEPVVASKLQFGLARGAEMPVCRIGRLASGDWSPKTAAAVLDLEARAEGLAEISPALVGGWAEVDAAVLSGPDELREAIAAPDGSIPAAKVRAVGQLIVATGSSPDEIIESGVTLPLVGVRGELVAKALGTLGLRSVDVQTHGLGPETWPRTQALTPTTTQPIGIGG